jgi:predicted ATP-grasp superfamily ATP-dependent carboligase
MAGVLLTDGQQRKTLAAARSLGRAGYQVMIGEQTAFATARFSRYCKKGLTSPSPGQREAYWSWLIDVGQRYGLDLLLPMDDLTTELAVERQASLPFSALLPTATQFGACRDKQQTAALAASAGVPAPKTLPASTWTEAVESATACRWQAVLKARTSSGGRGIFFIDGPDDLAAAWRKIRPEWGGSLMQARIAQGRKYDVALLYGPEGDLRASFVQEELRWFPLQYGASTLQESVHRPDLVALATRLLSPIGWRGPVEVEFMEDPSGTPYLMEVNPRFWASLALAIRCGVNFPLLTVQLAAGEEAWGPNEYPTGLRTRWLLPGDLLHFAVNPHRFRMHPSFFQTNDRLTQDDILSWDDPGPTFGFFLAALRYIWDPEMWRFLMRW